MTAKKKRTSPDPASKKKTPAKGPTRATPELVSPAAAKAAKAASSKSSALDAAARVLRESGQPMSCPELIEQMAAKGYWTSPKGRTPASTLYAAMAREVKLKGAASRFIKTGPGRFAPRPDTKRS
jgi:HB1/ASXL restriction endonuclease-like protein with HTH domain